MSDYGMAETSLAPVALRIYQPKNAAWGLAQKSTGFKQNV